MLESGWLLIGAKWAAASATAYWLGMGESIKILLGLMALDILTGIIAGFQAQDLSAKAASKGIGKKAGVLIIIVAVHLISDVAGNHFKMPIDLSGIVAWFYVLSETISLVENCARMGVPIPPILIAALRKAKSLHEQQEAALIGVQEKQQAAVDTAKQAKASAEEAQKATDKLLDVMPVAEENPIKAEPAHEDTPMFKGDWKNKTPW